MEGRRCGNLVKNGRRAVIENSEAHEEVFEVPSAIVFACRIKTDMECSRLRVEHQGSGVGCTIAVVLEFLLVEPGAFIFKFAGMPVLIAFVREVPIVAAGDRAR